MTKSVAVVGVHEAKTHLSRLLARVEAGEEIEISNRGHVVARLVPAGDRTRAPELGWAAGTVWISEDFDDPLPDDLLDLFGT